MSRAKATSARKPRRFRRKRGEPARLGLFGGAFNPVHAGHLRLARAAVRELRLDRLYWVPTGVPPHKTANDLAPASDRLAMVRAAIRREPRMAASDWEIRRKRLSYTFRTLAAFKKEHPGAVWHLVVGGDSFRAFCTWRRWPTLLREASLIVGLRRGVDASDAPSAVRRAAIILKARLPEVSSSDVRGRLRSGLPVTRLLPPAVAAYIRRRKLYAA